MPECSSDSTFYLLIMVFVLLFLGLSEIKKLVKTRLATIEAKLDTLIVSVESRDRA